MRPRGAALWPPLAFLAAIYMVVFAADWLAPYEYYAQDRLRPWAPPSVPRFVDAEGRFHLRPFVYDLVELPGQPGEPMVDRSRKHFLRFFVRSSEPRRWGPFRARWRLFSVDGEARAYLLGGDRFGRDQLSRLLYGGRYSLGAGLLAGVAAMILGTGLGALAGFRGGWIDALLMRFGELSMAIPTLYLLVVVRAVLPLELSAGEAFLVTVLVVSLLGWVRPARLVRGVVMSARQRDFVTAGRGFGASELYLFRRHVLPQVRSVVLTHSAIIIPRLVLAEVTLSFLGLGIAEPAPSWGLMLAELRRYDVLVSYWWMSAPVVALIGTIIGYHRLASVLQRRLAMSASL